MANNPVGWFEIYVQDIARATKFYQAVFGVKLEPLGTPTTEASSPEMASLKMMAFPMKMGGFGAGGALVKMDGFPSGGNSTLVYFTCEDCATEASRVASAGGRIQREKFSIGQYGFIALAFDTEGNMFGMHSMK